MNDAKFKPGDFVRCRADPGITGWVRHESFEDPSRLLVYIGLHNMEHIFSPNELILVSEDVCEIPL